MVKEIVKDLETLKTVSSPYMKADADIIQDLLDTAEAHRDACAGLAAIQLGYPVKAFVMGTFTQTDGKKFIPVINPAIIRRSPRTYIATEGCLSLEGQRQVKRHEWVEVIYETRSGGRVSKRLTGFQAEVFQHEFDHTKGIII